MGRWPATTTDRARSGLVRKFSFFFFFELSPKSRSFPMDKKNYFFQIKEMLAKKNKIDPNAPPVGRLPLPEL